MANLEKKVMGVDVSSKTLTLSYNNENHQNVVVNIGNNKTDIQRLFKNLDTTIYKVEIKKNKKLLTSIKGIGDKTALLLLIATNNFKNFKNDKALSKYFGVAPRLYHSGNKKISLGKCRTSKSFIRSVLYVCSWSAMKYNAQCKALYERIVEKGKSKKLALIAVCNKLL